jgi:hypothetical protein
MSEQPRDWDKELAKIDRAMAQQPPQANPPAAKPAVAPAVLPTPQPGRRAGTTSWLRVLLVVVLALAMPFWPYGRGCGFGLAAYLAAAGIVVVSGVWASVSSWRTHRPLAHVVALLVTLWGLGLVAATVLPRVGYAKQTVRWTCG